MTQATAHTASQTGTPTRRPRQAGMRKTAPWQLGASALLAALMLQACGGGGGSASPVASSSQLASGTVTGFGSVFVDGVEIEDAKASVVTENADGSVSNSVLQMGQRIRVNHDGKGSASKVTVDAAVVGAVSAINTSAGTFTVAGQTVRTNTDSAAGPLTVWAGGYSSLSDVAANDLVEVHGSPVYDSTSKTYTVTATRVQKMASIAALKVNGTISGLNTSTQTFTLSGLTVNYSSATLSPSSAALADGVQVSVYGPSSALTGTTLQASRLKLNRLQDSAATDTTAQIGGQVSGYDSSAKTFTLQGVTVKAGSATLSPSTAVLSNNAYVKVSGTVGSDGSISATSIEVRQQNTSSDLATVKLKGVISDFVDASSFVVRGVPVDASGISASALATSCPGVTLANGVQVQVNASQQAGTAVVLATSLSCQASTDTVIRPADGVASSVDSTAKTFVLTPSSTSTTSTTSATTVQWSDNTAFVGVTASTLDSKQVRVEGYLSGSTLVARVIRVAGAKDGLDDDRFQRKAGGESSNDSAQQAWSDYRVKKARR